MSFAAAAPWAWIPIVLAAALAQTVRNAAQRTLTATAGTLAATLVRFLYGLPVAVAWLLVVRHGWDGALAGSLPPVFGSGYAAWLATGAVAQLGATAMLLMAMQQRNFIVAVTWSKTEVLQVAAFSAVFLHELPGAMALAAMVTATVGVVLLSRPKPGAGGTAAAGAGTRAVLYGLASGAGFALSAVGYRGAALELPGVSPWLIGAWNVVWAQLLQSLLLGGWLLWRSPAALGVIVRAWRLSLVAGTMGALASIGWLTAMALRPAADVRTLGLAEVFFSYLVSRRIFREQLTSVEKAGLLLVAAGLVGVCLQL
ncbi:EamA/RhaT family transporter [uncultured Xylophilus sp.]|uniref:EamA/RhaT family transporter n=1 Tax=uncultured Xylophilus sp. TaxID=296832 RepID=UPI0025F0C74A|nr:EamA/RhaT family transporter [uncultured Xylophilus sp.]